MVDTRSAERLVPFALPTNEKRREGVVWNFIQNPLESVYFGWSFGTQLQPRGLGWAVGSRRRTRYKPFLGKRPSRQSAEV